MQIRLRTLLWTGCAIAAIAIAPALWASGIVQSAYNLVLSAGSAVTPRTTMNFVSGCTAADNAGANRTDVTCSGGTGITALTGDVTASGTGSVAATVAGLKNVLFCTGYTPTNGQFVQYTTGSSPNPCYTSNTASGGGGSGGGWSGWSGLPLTFVTNATQFSAPVGGALTSTTESVVQLKASTTATISGLQVSISAALGVSATLAVTLRDGGVSQALTCTTASGGTSCSDTTHSVSVNQGDLISFQLVSGGSVTAGLPQIEIQYSVLSGTGSFSAIVPYYSDGVHKIVAATGYIATTPSGSPTWINSVTPTVTTGANGNLQFTGTGHYWATSAGTTSAEAELLLQSTATGEAAGVWLQDQTNNLIYEWTVQSGDGTHGFVVLVLNSYSYNGTGNPAFSANLYEQFAVAQGVYHLKAVKSGGTASFQMSLDGGATFGTITTHSIGTVNNGGYSGVGTGSAAFFANILSILVS